MISGLFSNTELAAFVIILGDKSTYPPPSRLIIVDCVVVVVVVIAVVFAVVVDDVDDDADDVFVAFIFCIISLTSLS